MKSIHYRLQYSVTAFQGISIAHVVIHATNLSLCRVLFLLSKYTCMCHKNFHVQTHTTLMHTHTLLFALCSLFNHLLGKVLFNFGNNLTDSPSSENSDQLQQNCDMGKMLHYVHVK